MEEIKKDIETIPHVFEVAYIKNYVNEINQNLQKIGLIIAGFVSILLVTVVVLINNAIKLALFSQRFLIRSMQLVGATDFFIQKPFLMRATLHGLISAVFAYGLLVTILVFAQSQLPEIRAVVQWGEVGLIVLLQIGVGIAVCYWSAQSAVGRYLRKNLDELH